MSHYIVRYQKIKIKLLGKGNSKPLHASVWFIRAPECLYHSNTPDSVQAYSVLKANPASSSKGGTSLTILRECCSS